MTILIYTLIHLGNLHFADDFCSGDGAGCSTGLPPAHASSGQLANILQIVFGIIAALAVLMIILGAFRFTTSQGNPQEAGKARGTIAYALVGLIVALSAEAIVAFTLGKLSS